MSANHDHRIQSDMRKAKGLGGAHEGLHHWMAQRITALAAIPLNLWAVYSIFILAGLPYENFTAYFALPWNALLAVLFVLSTFYHAVLGTQVIMEDYIATHWLRMTKLIAQKLFFAALGVAVIMSVLKIYFAG